MIKLVALIKAKPGMSRADFIDYYENRHVPLILENLPNPMHYRRNYVVPDSIFRVGGATGAAPVLPFDVITEVWYRDRAHYDAMVASYTTSQSATIVANDEANFVDLAAAWRFLVDERVTEVAPPTRPMTSNGKSEQTKLFAMITAKPGMSRADFMDHYENIHVPMIVEALPQLCRYRRNYVLADTAGDTGSAPPSLYFDVMTEVWYENRARYDAMRAALADPAVHGPLREDTKKFVDQPAELGCLVEEYITELSGLPEGAREEASAI